jgi:hypothetical protein
VLPTSTSARVFGLARLFCASVISLTALAGPTEAMMIVARYDASVTSQSSAAAIETAFNAVAHDYSSLFSNAATVYVNVSWGSVAGQALPSNAVGASVDNIYGYFTYSQVRARLSGFRPPTPPTPPWRGRSRRCLSPARPDRPTM